MQPAGSSSRADKVWLVGGGLPAPWTYGQLRAALLGRGPASDGPPASVADALFALTQALHGRRAIALGEVSFAGEGAAQCALAGACDDAGAFDEAKFVAGLVGAPEVEIGLLTSGTTGRPRLVTHSVRSLMRSLAVNARRRSDVWGLAFNPTHIAGVQVYLQALANANPVVNLWAVERGKAIERCRRWGVTHLSATPTFYRLLLAHEFALPAVRSISIGGEAADANLAASLRARFPEARLHNIYASTEAGTMLVSDGAEFLLEQNPNVRIAEERLWVHRSVLGRFDGVPEWYDTGDAVEIIATKPVRFRIVGRARSGINVGGEKVNPHEVESMLSGHPGVAAVRVFGRRNSVTGEILAAEVVARGAPPAEAELRDYLAGHLPPFKIPRIIRFVERLEMTRTGKMKRDV